jgi:hypothetical protein
VLNQRQRLHRIVVEGAAWGAVQADTSSFNTMCEPPDLGWLHWCARDSGPDNDSECYKCNIDWLICSWRLRMCTLCVRTASRVVLTSLVNWPEQLMII